MDVRIVKDYYGFNEDKRRVTCREIAELYATNSDYSNPVVIKKMLDMKVKRYRYIITKELSNTYTFLDKMIEDNRITRVLAYRLYRDKILTAKEFLDTDFKSINYPNWEVYEDAKKILCNTVSTIYPIVQTNLYKLLVDETMETITKKGFLKESFYNRFLHKNFLKGKNGGYTDKYVHQMTLFEFTEWVLKNPNSLLEEDGFGPARIRYVLEFLEKIYGVKLNVIWSPQNINFILGFAGDAKILTLIEEFRKGDTKNE